MTRSVSKLNSRYNITEVSFRVVVTSMMTIFIPVLFVLLTFFVNESISGHPWNEKFGMSSSTCTTDECYAQATFLTNIINTQLNPCNDFYEYVCGNWEKKNENPIFYPEWSIDGEMGERSFHFIRTILEEPITVQDSDVIKKAKEFFAQCLQLPHLGLYDDIILSSYVRSAGYFPMFKSLDANSEKRPWTEIQDYYIGLTGESALFDITFRNPEARNYEPTIYLSDITSPYGLFIPKEPFTVAKLKVYAVFLTSILNQVIKQKAYWKAYSFIEKDLMDVLAFRRALYGIKLEHFIANRRNKFMTVSDLDVWFREMAKGQKTHISWIEVFRNLFRNIYPYNKLKGIVVNVQNKIYFRLLLRLLNTTPDHVIVNHIHLYFIERHLLMNTYLRDRMMEVITDHGKLLGIVRYIGKRWHVCIAMNSVKDQLGYIYVSRYFPAKTKQMAEHLVLELKAMMDMTISDSPWLNTYAKDRSKQLITDMKTTIGYPQYYDDYTKRIDFMERTIEPGKIDAIYSPYSNRISISAAYLSPPMFSTDLPRAIIYGATGMNIGHEMYHAFGLDHIDRREKEYSWPQEMLHVYRNKAECFVKQFDGIPVKELKHVAPTPRINGTSTVDENIADTMGLKLAFQAFKRRLWLTRTCESLPNLPNVNCMKLFFVSFAMSFCSVLTPDAMMEYVETGVYGTPRLRVNGAVANIKEFAKIYNCPEKTALNPKKKCNLWK